MQTDVRIPHSAGRFSIKRLWLFLVLCAPLAHAASFDCSKATTPVEKAICSDPHLSALDDQLNKAYQAALAKAGEADVVVRHDQRAWLSDLQDTCTGDQIRACIEQRETDRIAKLNATQPFNPSSVTEYKVTNASRYFDFTVRIFAKPVEAGFEDTREGPGRILIYAKGQTTPMQTIVMNNMYISLDKTHQALTNTADLYDFQGFLNVGDFNFDGHEDLGIQNGNNGAYAQPSYDIYLYSPDKHIFEFNKPLTNLIASTLGFFDVDPGKKLLTTLAKDGCCYHETTQYAVVNNQPVGVSREIDDDTKSDKYELVINQRMVAGKWTTVATKKVPQDRSQ